MHLGIRSLRVCLFLVFGAAFCATASQAAATSEFRALLDLDNNPGTGCTVATADGPFTGVERVLVTTVDLTQTPPAVISVASQVCTVPATNTFGPLVPITSPFTPPWPVGVGNGTGGADVVETYLPLGGASATAIRLGFTADVVGGTGAADADLTTTGTPGGAPIILSAAPIAAVPTLGTLGLLLLALLVAACALHLLRRRNQGGRNSAVAAVATFLLLTIGLGIAWADITPNGSVSDWAGIPPIAIDVVGDAPPNADLVAEFATIQDNTLFIRFDARIVGLPQVVSTTPANGATGVAGSATVTVNFNEPVAIDGSSFTLECPTGTPVTFTVSPAAPGNSSAFTLTPSSTLPPGVTCSAHVVAAHIHDAEGLTPAANYPFSFTTDGPPTVTSTNPANGATGVGLGAPVTINFSKAVNATAASFKLECPVGTPEAFTVAPVAPVGGATTYTLTPSANLPSGTVCTVTVVAAQVTDTVGTHPNADFVFSYTTDVAPTVTSTTPNNGDSGLAVNSAVTINFSKAVTVTASAFKLECPVGTPEGFTLAPAPPPAGGATSFTLTPTANLPAGTTCTVTVVASQVQDVTAGTHLAADFVFSFTTDVAPTVTSTAPANGATQQAPSTTITINFSKAVNVTATAFKLECPVGTPEAFTVSPAPPGGATSFTLTPSVNLPINTTCTVTVVASQVTDVAAGTHLAADDVFSFGVGNPPAVTSTTPANGATAVLATAPISLTFNLPVNVTATAFTLECPVGTPQAFTLSPAPPGGVTTFTLTPTAALPAGAVCTVTAAASQITDTANGLHPTADYVFSFTVDTPPTVTGTSPVDGATSVPVNSTVTFTFNEAVNVTATAFTLECPTGTPTPFTLTPAPPGGATTFTLTPSADLPAGTVCTATAVASQIADASGTHLAADDAISFTVDTAPTVTSTSPVNGATAVPLGSTVSFTFSKAVNVTASAFTLECPTGTPEAFTLSPAPPGGATTFTLTPSAPLPAGITCTATAVASQIADLLGTHLAANFSVSFTTDVAPTVTSTSPVNGATQVPPSTTITVNFSKAVNVTATAFKLECPTGTLHPFAGTAGRGDQLHADAFRRAAGGHHLHRDGGRLAGDRRRRGHPPGIRFHVLVHHRHAADGDLDDADQRRHGGARLDRHHHQLQQAGERHRAGLQAGVPGGHAGSVHRQPVAAGRRLDLHTDAFVASAGRRDVHGDGDRRRHHGHRRQHQHGGRLRVLVHRRFAAHGDLHVAGERRLLGAGEQHGDVRLQQGGERHRVGVHPGLSDRHAGGVHLEPGAAGGRHDVHPDADGQPAGRHGVHGDGRGVADRRPRRHAPGGG
jgi:methionine-rich copper-binding protein CopC